MAIAILYGFSKWNEVNEAPYKEIEPLNNTDPKVYQVFRAAILGELTIFKTKWKELDDNERHRLLREAVRVEQAQYLIVEKFTYFNIFETAIKHNRNEIVAYLLHENDSLGLYLLALNSLTESLKKEWLVFEKTQEPLIWKPEPESLCYILKSIGDDSTLKDFIRNKGLSLNPTWYDEAWKEQQSCFEN